MNIISLGHLSFTTFWIEISIIALNFLGFPSIIFGLLGPSEYYLDTRFAWFLLLGLYIIFFLISFLFSWGYVSIPYSSGQCFFSHIVKGQA